jgi:hypothetical protein
LCWARPIRQAAGRGACWRRCRYEIVANRIVEFAKTGERNPDLLCEDVLNEFATERL